MKSIAFLFLLSVLVVAICSVPASAATPEQSIQTLCTGSASSAQQAKSGLEKYPADSIAKWLTDFSQYPHADTVGRFVHISHKISDTLTAPAFLYVPKSYDPNHALPLVMYLHGGVSTKDFPAVSDSELMTDDLFKICEEKGWFYLFPLAKMGCLWWNDIGMNHLEWLLREVKRQYAINNDRVIVCGFSDGGSGSYHLSMTEPTDFAQLFPWSGHMAVGSLDGSQQQNLPNMRARPLFATVGGVDQLYPTRRMLPMLELAQSAGANLNVTVYDTATHNDAYLVFEYPAMMKRIEQYVRNAIQSSLYWETSDLHYGSVDWLSITGLDTSRNAAPWYKEYNCKLVDDNVVIGFNADREWKGDGVRVDAVLGDSTSVASKLGLKQEDVIVAIDSFAVHNMKDLAKARATKKRGDKVTVTFLHGPENRLTKTTEFPPIQEYDAFPRKAKTGVVVAHRIGNRFELETSRVKSFTLLLNPEMIRFEQPVVVVVNGKTVFESNVAKDSKLMMEKFIENRDKKLLWWGKVDVTID